MKDIKNDLELNSHLMNIRNAADSFNKLVRDGERGRLWEALETAQHEALRALYRLNDLRFQKPEGT